MHFQGLVDCVNAPCAVLSVSCAADGGCGEIRVESRNAAMAEIMGEQFQPGSPYNGGKYRNMRFEEFCFRAAIRRQSIHDYSYVNALNSWGEMQMIPLGSAVEGIGYCQFIVEPTKPEEAKHMAKVSPEAGEAVIKACITLMGGEDLVCSAESVLQDILDVSDAWCCRIVLTDNERKTIRNFCECIRPNLETGEKRFDLIRKWEETIGLERTVIVTNKTEMQVLKKHNPVWTSRMQEFGLESMLMVPMRRDQTTIGFFYMVNFRTDKVVELKELTELTSFFLGVQISNRLLMERLEEMSYTDALTGLRNRNAMIRRLRTMEQSAFRESFGVVNLDLNGLKTVNDTMGHAAGDQLLVCAAEMLTKAFYEEDVFRTGGDEFVIIAGGIDEETFLRKLERLRAAIQKASKVRLAMGCCWSDGTGDIHATFRKADERMYADKVAYYIAHPELRRN